jgi:hypothetical protein
MPWQAQLYIGVPVRNYAEIRRTFKQLKVKVPKKLADEDLFYDAPGLDTLVRYKGRFFLVSVHAMHEDEGGEFPVEDDDDSPCAIVGFPLTDRYKGAILDAHIPHGRPEPFVFDPLECQALLKQVRAWWPEAKLMIWEQFY